jgi:hypothetical protein
MKIQSEIRYSQLPAAVSTMIGDPAFQDRKCAATGALDHTVAVTDQAGRTTILTERDMPTDKFPDFLKSLVGKTLKVVQTDDWAPAAADGSRDGSTTVVITGTPLKLTGILRLRPETGGSVVHLDAELKASLPLIGAKVEKAAAPAILSAVRAEEKTAARWFDEH